MKSQALAALAESHKAISESRPNIVVSHPAQSESNFYQQEAHRLRLELENAHLELRNAAVIIVVTFIHSSVQQRTIDQLRTQKEQLEQNQKDPKETKSQKDRKVFAAAGSDEFEERYTRGSRWAPERVVEKVVEREVFKDPDDVRREIVRRVDRLMDIYKRNTAGYLKPYLFFIWRLTIAMQHLLTRYKQAKAQLEDKFLPIASSHSNSLMIEVRWLKLCTRKQS